MESEKRRRCEEAGKQKMFLLLLPPTRTREVKVGRDRGSAVYASSRLHLFASPWSDGSLLCLLQSDTDSEGKAENDGRKKETYPLLYFVQLLSFSLSH